MPKFFVGNEGHKNKEESVIDVKNVICLLFRKETIWTLIIIHVFMKQLLHNRPTLWQVGIMFGKYFPVFDSNPNFL